MRHPPLQPGWIDRPHQSVPIGDLPLESGEAIRDCTLSFVRHGTGREMILCLTAIGSTHHRFDPWIGPGRALDTDRYTVLCVDALGNGLSSSPTNSTEQPGLAFPRFTIRDMVESQWRLLRNQLNLDHVQAVVGASMGGMQAMQWAVSHPGFARKVVALTASAKSAPWTVAVNEAARRCLMVGSDWASGASAVTWEAWTALMHVLIARTPATVRGDVVKEIEERAAANRDSGISAIDWVYQSWAYDSHDLGRTDGCVDWRDALRRIDVPALLMAPPLDLYNPSEESRAAALYMPNAQFIEIPSPEGHAAAANLRVEDTAFIDAAIRGFLS
jgi:homoserine O-acetyltransferase/O-succinyltransferase